MANTIRLYLNGNFWKDIYIDDSRNSVHYDVMENSLPDYTTAVWEDEYIDRGIHHVEFVYNNVSTEDGIPIFSVSNNNLFITENGLRWKEKDKETTYMDSMNKEIREKNKIHDRFEILDL